MKSPASITRLCAVAVVYIVRAVGADEPLSSAQSLQAPATGKGRAHATNSAVATNRDPIAKINETSQRTSAMTPSDATFAQSDIGGTQPTADCNSNGTNDPEESDYIDCNTNNQHDACEVASAVIDCNADGFIDACQTAGTLLIASNLNSGAPTGVSHISDQRGGLVLADDFYLSSACTITGVQVTGFFASPGAGPASSDNFIIRIWSDAGGPSSQLSSQFVPTSAISRTGGYTHTMRLPRAVLLAPGKYWLEAIYSGSAPGIWKWDSLSPSLGSFSRYSTGSFPETWFSTGLDSHWSFKIFFGSSDADTNSIPDECLSNACLSCSGDLNADGRIDGTDIRSFVDVLLTGHAGSFQVNCADMNHDGQVNMADGALFTARLMDTNYTCPSPPLASLAPAKRLFIRYLPDGGYKLSEGIPQPTLQRDYILADLPNVAVAGFKRFATTHRMGVARSEVEAEAYYAPIVAKAHASNIKFIPGFWLLNVIDVVHGVPFEPPWNMPNTTYSKQNHPMNPSALGQQAFWDVFVQVSRTLAQAAHSDQVYIDCEDVFWRHQDNAFWTDENIAAVRVMLRAALVELRNDGIFIMIHQPRPQPTPNNVYRIAVGLFAPDGPDDALAHIEHTALSPGQRIVPGTLPTIAQVQGWYTNNNFQVEQVRFGFTEYSAPGSGIYGYLPAEFNAMLVANPAIVNQSWFFAGDANSPNHAAAFAALGPPALP